MTTTPERFEDKLREIVNNTQAKAILKLIRESMPEEKTINYGRWGQIPNYEGWNAYRTEFLQRIGEDHEA